LYGSVENSERQTELEKIGVQLRVGWGTSRPVLEQVHSCTEACSFFGHTETWVTIEPVAYEVHFLNGEFNRNPNKKAYWIFKRYLKKERKLDFPEVRPEFECKKCGLRIDFQHIEDTVGFSHKCRLHYAITVNMPLSIARKSSVYSFNVGTIVETKDGREVNGLTEEQFYAWISRYRGFFLAREECSIQVRSAWGP
jgi:hypothetical protein